MFALIIGYERGSVPEASNTDHERLPVAHQTVATVMAMLPPHVLVQGLYVGEESDRVITVTVPPTRDADRIVEQYAKAYTRNSQLLVSLIGGNRNESNVSYETAAKREIEHLQKLETQPRSPESVVLVGIVVDGPPDQVAQFKKALEEKF